LWPGEVLRYPALRDAEKKLADLFVVDPKNGIRPTITVLNPEGDTEYKDILVNVREISADRERNKTLKEGADELRDDLYRLEELLPKIEDGEAKKILHLQLLEIQDKLKTLRKQYPSKVESKPGSRSGTQGRQQPGLDKQVSEQATGSLLFGAEMREIQPQLQQINANQAERDFKIGEHYSQTGHADSALFYFEIVRRRYPGTPLAAKAKQRIEELKRPTPARIP
jgi:hypothetical protein